MTNLSMHTPMPVLHVTGDAAARGHQHGEALRDSIAECVAIYDGTFKLPGEEVATRAAHFEAVTRAWHGDLAAEIDAIADASGQLRSWVWALNARSEIMSYTGTEASECSSVWSPSTRILAQNWDWMSTLEPVTVVLDATHSDGHHVVTVTEPGMVGKVGMSSAGTAVGLNFLLSNKSLAGVPIHVLLRALLDARDDQEVEKLISTAGSGRSGHVFLARASGVGSSIEYSGSKMWREDSGDAPLLHTNHFVNGGAEGDAIPKGAGEANSDARYRRSEALLNERGVDSAEAIRAMLDDSDGNFPICRAWAPSATIPGAEVGTVCAIVMRLADQAMDVRRGPDPTGAWQSHDV